MALATALGGVAVALEVAGEGVDSLAAEDGVPLVPAVDGVPSPSFRASICWRAAASFFSRFSRSQPPSHIRDDGNKYMFIYTGYVVSYGIIFYT